MEKFYTTATLEDIENYLKSDKKLCKKLSIIETSCSTLFYKPYSKKVGYTFTVVNRGDVREIDVHYIGVGGAGARRSSAISKTLFEMLFGMENFKKVGK